MQGSKIMIIRRNILWPVVQPFSSVVVRSRILQSTIEPLQGKKHILKTLACSVRVMGCLEIFMCSMYTVLRYKKSLRNS